MADDIAFLSSAKPLDRYAYGPIPGVPDDVMECIPKSGMVHEYVWWASQITYASPIWHVGAILPAIAYELAAQGWSLPGRKSQIALQSFLIGRPATAKSTCLRMARAFHEDMLSTKAQYSQGSWDPGKSPWFQSEGTVAGLLEALYDRFDEDLDITPSILFHEEVSSLLGSKDFGTIDILMQLFDAQPVVERMLVRYREMAKKGLTPPSRVVKPAIGGVFAGTISAMQNVLTSRHFQGGLVSRSLWLVAEPDVRRFDAVEEDDERLPQRAEVLGRWTQYGPHLFGLRARGDAQFAPFTPAVKAIIEDNLVARFRSAFSAHDDHIAPTLQRAIQLARLITRLYAMSRGSLQASEEDARAAVALVQWSVRSAELLGGLTSDNEGWRMRTRALELCEQAGEVGIDRRSLYKALHISKGELDQVIASMLDEGIIVERRGRHTNGRPKAIYTIPGAAPMGKVIELDRHRSD